MKNLLILLVSIVLLSSCVTQRKCMDKFPPPPNDTITNTKIVETIRDTTIIVEIPADTVYKMEPIKIGPDGIVNHPKIRLDTKHAWAEAWVENNVLKMKLYQKESEIEATIQGAIREYVENNTTTIVEYVYVPVEFTWWETLYLTIGKITFIVLSTLTGASIGFFLLKLKFPGLKLW